MRVVMSLLTPLTWLEVPCRILSCLTVLVSRVSLVLFTGKHFSLPSREFVLTCLSLAAQEVLRWIIQMKEAIPANYTEQDVNDYLWSTLNSGRVVPGYGHAVLRKPDPRFEALMDYAAARPEIANDPVFQLVEKNSRIAPEVLKKHGKTKN